MGLKLRSAPQKSSFLGGILLHKHTHGLQHFYDKIIDSSFSGHLPVVSSVTLCK